jgi:hypothetical protein
VILSPRKLPSIFPEGTRRLATTHSSRNREGDEEEKRLPSRRRRGRK